jgi:hypothetical protein
MLPHLPPVPSTVLNLAWRKITPNAIIDGSGQLSLSKDFTASLSGGLIKGGSSGEGHATGGAPSRCQKIILSGSRRAICWVRL